MKSLPFLMVCLNLLVIFMARKKKDIITLLREDAIKSGRVVETKRDINPKIKMQLLKNYGLVVREGPS